MSNLGTLLLILASLCLGACVISAFAAQRRRAAAGDRLRALAGRLQAPGARGEQTIIRNRLGRRSLVDTTLSVLPFFRRIELLLYRAEIAMPAWRFIALSVLLGAIAGYAGLSTLHSVSSAASLAGIGFALPWLIAGWRKRKRMRLFEIQLPEALDMICRALRAGHALSTGLRMVGDGHDDPIAREFAHVADEMALGLDSRQALANLCHRIDAPDLAFFSTAILIQRETGGNLAEIMSKLGYVIRQRHQLYGKVRAMTAQNRGAAAILLCAPIAFVVLMNLTSPDFIEPLFRTHAGRMLGVVCGTLTVVGYAVARRLAVVRA